MKRPKTYSFLKFIMIFLAINILAFYGLNIGQPGDNSMNIKTNNDVTLKTTPKIDSEAPRQFETATFALG